MNTHLSDTALALKIANFAMHTQAPVLVIAKNQLQLEKLLAALQFFMADETKTCAHFPAWETLAYDQFSAHETIVSERLQCLASIKQATQAITLTSIQALMNRIAPPQFIDAHCFYYHVGQQLPREILRENLITQGYRLVSEVIEHGDFAIRGAIMDIFPMGAPYPFRLEWFDDEIDTLRSFDPETQLSLEKVEKITLLPAYEYPLEEKARAHFRQHWRAYFNGNPLACPVYQDVSDGLSSPGLEYFIALFFETTASLVDYLPKNTCIIRLPGLHEEAGQFYAEAEKRYAQLSHDLIRPILKPQDAFFRPNECFAKLNQFSNDTLEAMPPDAFPNLLVDPKHTEPFHRLQQFLQDNPKHTLFCAESRGRRDVLNQMLHAQGIKTRLVDNWKAFLHDSQSHCLTVANLDEGIIDPSFQLITETQLLGEHAGYHRTRKKKQAEQYALDIEIKSLAELKTGDPVVHIDHGVGRYLGLEVITHENQANEYLTIAYAHQAKLFVPVTDLHLISRYSTGDAENAPLHTLGSDKWQREKRKAREKVRDVAAELLEIYAKREMRKGHAYTIEETAYQLFASQFPFNETPDQTLAIEKIIEDMTAEKPMDRLLCGDVGFGKTEVAMRAAFIAAMNHKQVAVLTPTTLLTQQHFQTFCDRFADFPLKIGIVSRFISPSQQKQALLELALGKLDIIIGTHKLLSKDVKFKDLGLVIIDEEHRFGVNQKERLKALRAEVDILTMTATPIPRTLNLAFATLRDLSIIATPPAKRLSIKTFVQKRQDGIVREAILREITRGGQVYFLHNNVETIQKTAQALEILVPEARIGIGHGQMHERQLERTMVDFYHRRFNVLVATTIIETGIDVPTANTIIIDRADRFGLAQLHQLRGRVGRSHHQAYAYLLIPDPKSMTQDAQKRLEAISTHEALGSGFMLATHDLEIRGAGELLGDKQSGEIHAVGFTLYMEMLERAVQSLKAGVVLDIDQPPEEKISIDLGLSTIIPEDYLPDIHLRLTFYKRISQADDEAALTQLKIEMIDRFGTLPPSCENLLAIQALKQKAIKTGLVKIDRHKNKLKLHFQAKPNICLQTLMQLIQTKKTLSLLGPTQVGIQLEPNLDRLQVVSEFLDAVAAR